MRVVAANPLGVITRRVLLERIDTLDYIAYEYEPEEMAERLSRHGYRGAICGPEGCGKSVMLQALGDELMAHGLTPLPLSIEQGDGYTLPTEWRRTIRKARPTDALLLDGYGLLPVWSRLWVWIASRHAGAVVVTAPRQVRYQTLAKPRPSKHMLKQLAERIAPTRSASIDCDTLFDQCGGNLREALRHVCEASADQHAQAESGHKQAG
ncbi:MAG: hypothetical protein AAF085_03135 [Planctomycetota bacterium]